MKNNNLKSIEELRKIIFEDFSSDLSELDVIDTNTPNDSSSEIGTIDKSSATEAALNSLYAKVPLKDQAKVNAAIETAKNNGRASLTFSSAIQSKHLEAFKYFASKLAVEYQQTKDENVYKALLTAFYDKAFFYQVTKSIMSFETLKGAKEKFDDIVVNALVGNGRGTDSMASIGSLKHSLRTYDITAGAGGKAFTYYLLFNTQRNAINLANSEFTETRPVKDADGNITYDRKLKPISYMSDKLGGDDEDSTIGDTIDSPEYGTEKVVNDRLTKKVHDKMIEWGKLILENYGTPKQVRLFELYFMHHVTDSKSIFSIMKDEGFYTDEHTKEIGKNQTTGLNDITTNKARINETLAEFIGKGELDDFIRQELGAHTNFASSMNNAKRKRWSMFYESIIPEDVYAEIMLSEVKEKFENINSLYDKLNIYFSKINESSDDTSELMNSITLFINNSSEALNKLGVDLHEIHNLAARIKPYNEEPSRLLEKTVEPLIETLFMYPRRLKEMLSLVRLRMNSKSMSTVNNSSQL